MSGVKQPRAPRRHQAEVDEARRIANELRAELRDVRAHRRRIVAAGELLYTALDTYFSAEYQCDNQDEIADALTVWQDARKAP